MKLENQVTSLDISRQMKEAGFPQDSFFYYTILQKEVYIKGKLDFVDDTSFLNSQHCYECETPRGYVGRIIPNCYAAYTVAELGEILPKGYYSLKECDTKLDTADARGKMALYLKKEGLI